MSNIGIIGAGIGGLTCAIKLSQAGHYVRLFERREENKLAHPWMDDIRFDIFEYAGLPLPPRESYFNKGKRLFISPDKKNSFHVPFSPPMVEISIERPALAKHLVSLAKEAGAELNFGVAAGDPVVSGDRVAGFFAGGEEQRFDLVIDSAGMRSSFRSALPKGLGIRPGIDDGDVMFAYRAFFNHRDGAPPPETDRNIYIKHLGSTGLSWCNLNQKDECDIFVGRLGGLTEEEIEGAVADLKASHAFFGDTELLPGMHAEIPLRSPLSMMVADGYVAIGDAAFMTMPMMGSGIEGSMKAAVFLTELIGKDRLKSFEKAELWPYQVRYFREVGARFAFVDVVKRWLLGIDTGLLDWLFGCGAVTDEDMGMVSTEGGKGISPGQILKKIAILFKKPEIIAQSAKWLGRAVRLKRAAMSIPENFDEVAVVRWRNNYEKAFESAKNK